MRSAREGVLALREALRAHGGTVAALLDEGSLSQLQLELPGPPQLVAHGPRALGHEADYELLFEMILEGSLLHYGCARVVRTEDRDLALLLGDQLYALGLSRLAELGDLDAVSELADLISLVAQAQAAADVELIDAVWDAGAAAIGWGGSAQHEGAKKLARSEAAGATAALMASAGSRS
jgi:hypothetical protein